MRSITYETYLRRYSSYPLIDVRSPSEYQKGHPPKAINIPLFSDRERAIVGTIYKQVGAKEALRQALKFVKMPILAKQADKLNSPFLVVYCFRGGMRSASVGWLFELLGYKVLILKRGYKGYRHFVLDQFNKSYPIAILSGQTGVGKTYFLKKLKYHVDLEDLALHKGSVFGALKRAQPTQENFENELAEKLFQFTQKNQQNYLWLEDESRMIGRLILPEPLFLQMQKAPGILLEDTMQKRVKRLVKSYHFVSPVKLKEAIFKLQKRLGGEATKKAIELLDAGDRKSCCSLLLHYYDKKYAFTLEKRKGSFLQLDLTLKSPLKGLKELKELIKTNFSTFEGIGSKKPV